MPRALGGPRQLAQIFRDQGEHQKIVALLEPIVTARLSAADAADLTSDTFRSTYFDLASAYEALRQFDKAIALLTQARALSPTDPLVDIRLARSQQEAGKGDDAIRTLQAAVTKFPKEPAVKLSLGSALERERKYSEAEAVFRQMIAADPKNADALNSLGYMFAERGQRLDEAVALVQRALAIEPGNGAYLDSLGWAYYKQNRFEQAETPLREAAKQLPDGVRDSGSSRRPAEQARLCSRKPSTPGRWRSTATANPSRAPRSTTRSNRHARSLAEKNKLALAILLFTIGSTACGPRRVALPAGPGRRRPILRRRLPSARAACEGVRTLQAELGCRAGPPGSGCAAASIAGLCPARCGSKASRRSAARLHPGRGRRREERCCCCAIGVCCGTRRRRRF